MVYDIGKASYNYQVKNKYIYNISIIAKYPIQTLSKVKKTIYAIVAKIKQIKNKNVFQS